MILKTSLSLSPEAEILISGSVCKPCLLKSTHSNAAKLQVQLYIVGALRNIYIFLIKCYIYKLKTESQGGGGRSGWQLYKVHDCHTTDLGSTPECVLGNKSTLVMVRKRLCFRLKVNEHVLFESLLSFSPVEPAYSLSP